MIYKRYVEMIEHVSREGVVTPLTLIWENGTKYPIDRILEIRKAASSVGGCGILYKCRIQGNIRNLYYEQHRWFIESQKP